MAYAIEGKKILVTGASSGIGRALAQAFAERGAVVGLCARRTQRLAEVLERVRARSPASRMWTIDLGELERLESFAREVEAALGGIDVLVNNAGIPKRRRVTALTPDVVEHVMRVNYASPVRLTLALLPGLIERRGRIINVSSVAARLGSPGEGAYAASKAALTAWSESMHVDLAETGVKVHVVNPGVIDTELFALPDNDPVLPAVEAQPVDSIVQPVFDQLDSGAFEIYVPGWFADLAQRKAADTGAFLDGAIAWLRETRTSGSK